MHKSSCRAHTSQGLLLSKTTEIVLQITNIDEINQIQNVMITKWYAVAATAKNVHDKNNDTLFTERSFFIYNAGIHRKSK